MQHIIIKIITLPSVLLIFNCTDMLSNDPDNYNSIHLQGGGWIQFNGHDTNNYLSNDFSFLGK